MSSSPCRRTFTPHPRHWARRRPSHLLAEHDLGDAPARTIFDAKGQIVAPGFIDLLGQSEGSVLIDPRLEGKVRQGVTTEVTGEGRSPGPWSDEAIDEINRTRPKGYPEVSWRTLGDYMRFLEDRGSAINFAFYVGATNAREIVLGRNNRQPNEAERKKGREVAANVYPYAATATALTALAPHLGARRGI